MNPPKEKTISKQPHHERNQLCTTRPAYRQGKKLTAVKVYTVSDESPHLIIRGVPSLNLCKELKHLCMRYGEVKQIHQVKGYAEDEESFTEVFHVTFARIQSSRFAKHMIDDKSFFGGILHVCYAPELETVSETRHKLDQRRHEVLKRLSQYTAADLRKSQKLSQSTTEPVPGPSGSGICHPSPVSTEYPSQHRFSSPNIPVHLFKNPPPRKGASSSAINSNLNKSRLQTPQKQNILVPIGPQLPSRVETKPAEQSDAKDLQVESNSKSSSTVSDSSAEKIQPEAIKRTDSSNLGKFIPPQVKRIRFN